jgi:hypothetical protein
LQEAPDQWFFYGEAGDFLFLDLNDPFIAMHVYDEDGLELGISPERPEELRLFLPHPGEYRIVLEPDAFRPKGQFYSLVVSPASARTLEGTVESNTIPKDRIWIFEGQAGEIVSLETTVDFFLDLDLLLYGPDGSLIGVGGDAGEGMNPKLVVRLPESGVYSVVVTVQNYRTHDNYYALTLTRPEPRTRDWMNYGDSVHSVWVGDSEHWQFTGAAGDQVCILLESETFNPAISLTNAEDQSIGWIYPNETSLILVLAELPTDGDYTITVTNPDPSSPCDYTLELDTVHVQPLEGRETIPTSISDSYGDFWLIDADEGDVVEAILDTVQICTRSLFLMTSTGKMLSQGEYDSSGNIHLNPYSLPEDGAYWLVVYIRQDPFDAWQCYDYTLTIR